MPEYIASRADVDMRSFEGQTIRDSYQLQSYIGEGNFGAVFKGTQLFLDLPIRTVAIKFSRYTNLDAETARQIFADAFVLARLMEELNDPEVCQHLVHVYDMGIDPQREKRGFIVMEYVEGTTLAAHMATLGHVPALLLLNWIRQICTTLQGLHALEPPLIHRDLKPDNIILGHDGIIRVVDFGLAARLMSQGHVRGIVGALGYMAPETMLGESIPASDIYSIGLMLYEGLTGKHPFLTRASLASQSFMQRDRWYKQLRMARLIPPSHLNNTASATLDTIVARCLHFYPNKRYADIGELLADLNGVYAKIKATGNN
ncbi:serine/threonine protein kinase [Ktedonosporobacter rubrisoli]|nr:serine/threonine-protein kinase [Ktedonosporobacter rubrisoli]